jgi:predicted DNA-binding transcriptional regulator YafY
LSQAERLHQIDRLLRGRTAPTKRHLIDALQVSEATIKRDVEYMRSRLGAPIEWDRETRGYRYDPAKPAFSLPGFWLTSAEIHALLLLSHVIDQMQPGFLRDQIEPFRQRIKQIANPQNRALGSITDRVYFIPNPFRLTDTKHLEIIVYATLLRRRVEICYESRGRGVQTRRTISPARLVYYRSQWYVDAWCHSANAQRRFAIDAVLSARTTSEAADELPGLGKTGYGIFSGTPTSTAVLKFTEKAGRWIRATEWHPDQKVSLMPDGAVHLEVPYSNSQELSMEILRYGSDVEVLAPADLRQAIADTLQDAAGLYSRPQRTNVSAARVGLKQAG